MDNKKVFEAKVDGKVLELAVLRPNHKVQQQAQLVYNRAFRQSVKPDDGKSGSIVRAALDGVLRDQKLWDDTKQARYEALQKALLGGEKRLVTGGFKLKEARELAIQMRRDRWELRQLISDRNSLDLNTAEAQAEQARFNYLVATATVHADTGKPYWKSEDDYLASTDEVGGKAANLLGNILYNLEDGFEAKLPENKWLTAYGFANAALHLIDKDSGHLIDSQGRRVDDKGRLVNEQGKLIDSEGNLLTEEGEYVVDFKPFLDDEGTPVPVPGESPAKPEMNTLPANAEAEAAPAAV